MQHRETRTDNIQFLAQWPWPLKASNPAVQILKIFANNRLPTAVFGFEQGRKGAKTVGCH